MLLLVLADGNVRRLVEKDVGRHQVGVGIEADRGVLLVLARLLFELRHPVEPAETGDAVEDPGELRMCGDLALVEDDMRPRVDARGQHRRRNLPRVGGQFPRVLPDGDGVQIDDAEDALEFLCSRTQLRIAPR